MLRWRVDVMLATGTAVFRDPAWRAFDRDRTVWQGSFTVRGDTRLGTGRLFLGGGATIRSFAAHGAPHDVFTTKFRSREPLAFVRLSVMALEGVDAFVQAGGGVSVLDLSLQSSVSTSQRSVVGMADGLAGVALYLPRRWLERRSAARVTGGLELGAGYTWRGDVAVRPGVNTDPDPIQTDSAHLGDVSPRGFTWRLGLFVRFQ